MSEHATSVKTATVSEAHDARRPGLSVHCPDSATWAGSFGVVVTALLSDVLTDDYGPVDATVYALDEDERVLRCYVGKVVSVAEESVTFADGVRLVIGNVVSLFI